MQIKSRISQITGAIRSNISGYRLNKAPGAGKVQIKSRMGQITGAISQVFPAISQIKVPGATKLQTKGGENITFSTPFHIYLLVFSNERMMNVANCWRVTASSGP